MSDNKNSMHISAKVLLMWELKERYKLLKSVEPKMLIKDIIYCVLSLPSVTWLSALNRLVIYKQLGPLLYYNTKKTMDTLYLSLLITSVVNTCIGVLYIVYYTCIIHV